MPGYGFGEGGEGVGYYRRPGAPPPPETEHSVHELERGAAAAAAFVPCGAPLEAYGHGPVLGGYVYRQGDEGRGYYFSPSSAAPPPAAGGGVAAEAVD